MFVMEHRTSIEMLVYDANADIKGYLKEEYRALLKHIDLHNTLPGLLDDQSAVSVVLGKMRFIADRC